MANIDSTVLDKYLVQVRKIAESREEGVEKQILKLYKVLVKDINGFLGNEYAKYAEDDSLTFEILYRKGEYARFLEEVNKKVDSVIPEVKEVVDGLVNDTYEKCYNGMVEGVKKSTTAEALWNEFKSVKAVRPEVIKAAVQNPIPKLRLTPTLERNRKQVISSIKREIAVGLSQGDRMYTMAKRLTDRVNINYRQSMLIARTEAHRVRETGLNDAANEVDEILKANGSEYRKIKIWNTSGDNAVRDTHEEMDGVAVLQDEKFELPSGATADCPGTSGVASEDCNCRCFLTHDIVTDEEFYAMTGRHFPGNEVENKEQKDENTEKPVEKSAYNSNIVFDLSNMSIEKQTEVIETITKLEQEYKTSLNRVIADADTFGANISHMSQGGVMHIAIIDKQEVVVHEFAHSIASTGAEKLGLQNNTEFWKEMKKLHKEYKTDVHRNGNREYALDAIGHADKVDEFLAEGFTAAYLQDASIDTKYPEKVKELIDKYFKNGLTSAGENGKIELTEYVGTKITETDNRHIREWYVANVSDIPNQIDTSKPTEEQARQAFELRNKYKSEARAAMSDKKTAAYLDNERPAKSFDDLLNDKIIRKGLTREEAIEDILKTSSTTNEDINKIFGL